MIVVMAEITGLSERVFKSILSDYNLGEYISSKLFTIGSVQANHLVRTTKTKLVLRHYQNRSERSVLFECNLLRYLRNRNFRCPAPYRNKNGEFVGIFMGKPYVIFEFMKGRHLRYPNKKQEKELIRKTARLHNITRNYRPRNRRYRWNFDSELCRKLAREKAQELNTPDAREKLKWYEVELSNLNLPKSLPKGVCHCDFHFSNMLFKNGKFNALIDFDDANYTYLTFDLAGLIEPLICPSEWGARSSLEKGKAAPDFTKTRELVSAYVRYRPLNHNEKRHLFDVVKLRILIDCI
jgi:homoserine kinase type II